MADNEMVDFLSGVRQLYKIERAAWIARVEQLEAMNKALEEELDALKAKQHSIASFGAGTLIMGNVALVDAIQDSATQLRRIVWLEMELQHKDEMIAALETGISIRDNGADVYLSKIAELEKSLDWYKSELERTRNRLIEQRRREKTP